MQFELEEKTRVNIGHVNVRSEMHGSDHVPAIDIGLSLMASNNTLSEFDGALKSMLYTVADGTQGEQETLAGVDPISDMPKLRSTMLGPLKLKKEYTGYTLTISYGIDDESAITIDGCDVNKFIIDAKEGGSIELKCRVQASGIEPRVLGLVGSMVGQEVEVTLTAPGY